jgi:MYXO-CTERM domain-containing protein
MDFIERLLGISPDGGDGSIEAMILGLLVLLGVAAAWRLRSKYMSPRS